MQCESGNLPPLRVLVVDASVCYRKIIASALQQIPGVDVIGVAVNGETGWQKIVQMKPDLVTLDLELPELNGLDVLQRMRASNNPSGVIMLSAATSANGAATAGAVPRGAFALVPKPIHGTWNENATQLHADLAETVTAFRRQYFHSAAHGASQANKTGSAPSPAGSDRRVPEVVVIGVSTGGPEALNRMLPRLPADFPAPVVIVQHMLAIFTRSLAADLDSRCALSVCEAADGQPLAAGTIYIAPGGRQTGLARLGTTLAIQLTDDPPENSCRPSVDYLFRSAAAVCGGRALGVIMTGMGNDGAIGCRLLKRAGAAIIAQDRASCVVYGMPLLPTQEGLADVVAPLDGMAAIIVERTLGAARYAGH